MGRGCACSPSAWIMEFLVAARGGARRHSNADAGAARDAERWPLLMPLLFMVILPQIDLRNKMSSQAANRLQGGFVVGEEEAARRLSDGYDAPLPELNIDPLGRNPEAGCQLGHRQMACDRGPSCLSMLHFEAVFLANGLDRNREDFFRLPCRGVPF